MDQKIPIEISARHIHLFKQDSDKLFGAGYQIKKLRQLTQPCDFCAEERVDVIFGDKEIKNVRVVGPERDKTQVEISLTDAIFLKAQVPIKISGDLEGSSQIIVRGSNGQIELEKGLIIAARHLHCHTKEAKSLKVKNGDIISIKTISSRPVTFHNVIVRVSDEYKLCLHLDTDEGNAAGILGTGDGIIVKR